MQSCSKLLNCSSNNQACFFVNMYYTCITFSLFFFLFEYISYTRGHTRTYFILIFGKSCQWHEDRLLINVFISQSTNFSTLLANISDIVILLILIIVFSCCYVCIKYHSLFREILPDNRQDTSSQYTVKNVNCRLSHMRPIIVYRYNRYRKHFLWRINSPVYRKLFTNRECCYLQER